MKFLNTPINFEPPSYSYSSPNRFSNFLNNIGGASGAGMLLSGVSSLANLGVGIWSANEQLKQAKEAQKLARQQFFTENERYNTREQERLANNKAIEEVAKSYGLNKESPSNNETNAFNSPMLRD
ncbi:hypothetical protein [Helicobacter cetorum]|uniref:Uncharacterized protein n=1 Tax=Helicobacter cetorum (strain ATCC BAA-429 / MIT 00-7128) TaxID=182217 RepID=I0ELL9_HELC0|nr:hypothetical protein [Helicobacter cetorum]AFI03838.1 hypothetical protein HCW_02785 [Helicobacter cetorum MIT 00-7128]